MGRSGYDWIEEKELDASEVKEKIEWHIQDDRDFDMGSFSVAYGGTVSSIEDAKEGSYRKISNNEGIFYHFKGLGQEAAEKFYKSAPVKRLTDKIAAASKKLKDYRDKGHHKCGACASKVAARFIRWPSGFNEDSVPEKRQALLRAAGFNLPMGRKPGRCPLCDKHEIIVSDALIERNAKLLDSVNQLADQLEAKKEAFREKNSTVKTFISIISDHF